MSLKKDREFPFLFSSTPVSDPPRRDDTERPLNAPDSTFDSGLDEDSVLFKQSGSDESVLFKQCGPDDFSISTPFSTRFDSFRLTDDSGLELSDARRRILEDEKEEDENASFKRPRDLFSFVKDVAEPFSPPRPLIRRSFLRSSYEGREKLDFLKRLSEMNASHILKRLAGFLSGKDICAMCLVSKGWNAIVHSEYEFVRKRAGYLETFKSNGENAILEERRTRSTPRKAMENVSNLIVSSPNSYKRERFNETLSSVVSPSKIRHKLFTDEALKLGPGEQLQSCPRCTNPSRVVPAESRATCSRLSCGFDFCTKCMCGAHSGPGNVCRTPTKSSGKVSSHKSAVSTKKSRRRLKRL